MIGRYPHCLRVRAARAATVLIIAALVSACAQMGGSAPPVVDRSPAPGTVVAPAEGVWPRGKARWVATTWQELPGWEQDSTAQAWSALWRSCQRPTSPWLAVCARARAQGAAWGRQAGDNEVRQWLQANLKPWRVETADGQTTGLLTGYVEPLIEARRTPQGGFLTPLYRPPLGLAQRKPFYTRAELESLPEARASLTGRELLYVADPLDALLVQVQGSTRVRVLDELDPQGEPRLVRLAFAAHNDQPYQSVARWLVDQGAFPLEQASWGAIRAWAGLNPQRVTEMLNANPRVVFFREEPLVDPDVGPVGAQGVPLTPGRSIAVDKESVPYGTPVWLDTTEPQPWAPGGAPAKPLQRLAVAQDTGGAIVGAVRADYFWGWGDEALTQAGRTKQPLRMWALWPR